MSGSHSVYSYNGFSVKISIVKPTFFRVVIKQTKIVDAFSISFYDNLIIGGIKCVRFEQFV